MRKGVLSLFIIIALLVSAPALAQLSRTWVSGVGDDANTCSRTSPCRTFAGAIAKTAANGVILALDPGAYGAVTITKSITIDGQAQQASIFASGTTGITVSGTGIVVNIRNLSIDGEFTTAGSGIRILNAAAVNIDKCAIMNFTGTGTVGHGISIETAVANVRVTVSDSVLYNMGNAAIVSVPTAGNVVLTVDDTRMFRGEQRDRHPQSHEGDDQQLQPEQPFQGAGVVLEQTTAEAMISNTVLSNNSSAF